MPLIETKGAASAQGFGLTLSSGAVPYIEDVFSTYLYDGTAAAFSINNSIDLAGKGGLVWLKRRNAANSHWLYYQATKYASSNNDGAGGTSDPGYGITSYNSNGFSLGLNWAGENSSGGTYVSWTFREQPKFLDVVTYTGNGANRTIAHNLGSVPGCIMVKCLSTGATSWAVYHRSLANTQYLVLNDTAAEAAGTTYWNSTTPTSAVFSLGTNATVNSNGATYVAYLFAHDAGGFGASGTDNVISCGSFTTDGSYVGPNVNLGYEPQWILVKNSSANGAWYIIDNMRGWESGGNVTLLNPNSTSAESTTTQFKLNATGFQDNGAFAGNATMIYIAIRRGPMKVPTSGTSVFGANARSGTGANATVTGGQIADAALIKNRGSAVGDLFASRLTGTGYLETSSTAAEVAAGTTILQANPWDVMDGVKVGTTSTITNASGNTFINYLFRRAPSFFDVVCYTGTGSATQTVYHNLGVVPELVIFKNRTTGGAGQSWWTYCAALTNPLNKYGALESSVAFTDVGSAIWTAPTTSAITAISSFSLTTSSSNYVAYLFATCAGVSKVGSYTGTGALQTVNCGFTGGARFVLIKRTDSTGDWYLWDSARGIVAGNDPYILLNSTAAEVTSTDYVDTYSAGFEISSTAPAAINANGGTFVFLAIA